MHGVRTIGFLLAAFVVGVLSQHVGLGANAKSSIPEVVKAQSFALVDRNGNTVGLFAVQNDHSLNGSPAIVLYDSRGQVIWRAGSGTEPIGAMR